MVKALSTHMEVLLCWHIRWPSKGVDK